MSKAVTDMMVVALRLVNIFSQISKKYVDGYTKYRMRGELPANSYMKAYKYNLSADTQIVARWDKGRLINSEKNEPTFRIKAWYRQEDNHYVEGSELVFNMALYTEGLLNNFKNEIYKECGGSAKNVNLVKLKKIEKESIEGVIFRTRGELLADLAVGEAINEGRIVEKVIKFSEDYAVVVTKKTLYIREVAIRKVKEGKRASDWLKVTPDCLVIEGNRFNEKDVADFLTDGIAKLYYQQRGVSAFIVKWPSPVIELNRSAYIETVQNLYNFVEDRQEYEIQRIGFNERIVKRADGQIVVLNSNNKVVMSDVRLQPLIQECFTRKAS